MALEGRGLRHVFTQEDRVDLILDDVYISVEAGSVIGLLGKSGIGKTTIARILAGLLQPLGGEVLCDGKQVRQPDAPVALVFQDYDNAVFPWLTVEANMALGAGGELARSKVRRRIDEVASLLGIEEKLKRHPGMLSGGQKQRVQLGRALVGGAKYLILDEPTSSLDLRFKSEFHTILGELRTKNVGVLLVTHDIDEATYLSNELYIMSKRGKTAVALSKRSGFGQRTRTYGEAMRSDDFTTLFAKVATETFGAV